MAAPAGQQTNVYGPWAQQGQYGIRAARAIEKGSYKYPRNYEWPQGARPIKAAQWISYPKNGDPSQGFEIGLGRKRRSRKTGKRRTRRSKRRAPGKRLRRRSAAGSRRRLRRRATRRTGRGYRRGRGGFWDSLKQYGSAAARTLGESDFLPSLGGALGNLVAPGIGGQFGKAAGSRLGKILSGYGAYYPSGPQGVPSFMGGKGRFHKIRTGHGEYENVSSVPGSLGGGDLIGSNMDDIAGSSNMLARAITMKQEIPTIVNAGEGEVVIRHKEYIADIVSQGPAFDVVAFLHLNPGLAPEQGGAFPWLSRIAQQFQQYRFDGLTFEYRSTSGLSAVTQALGEIIVSTDYNSNAPQPLNKQQMVHNIFAITRVPAADFTHPIECAASQTNLNGLLFVRGGPIDPGMNINFYDLGVTTIACQGQTAPVGGGGITLGEIWVTYQVSLYKPQLASELPSGAPDTLAQNLAANYQIQYLNAGTPTFNTIFPAPVVVSPDLLGLSNPLAVVSGVSLPVVPGGAQPAFELFYDGSNVSNQSIRVNPGVRGTFKLNVTCVVQNDGFGSGNMTNMGMYISRVSTSHLGLSGCFLEIRPDVMNSVWHGQDTRTTGFSPLNTSYAGQNTPQIPLAVINAAAGDPTNLIFNFDTMVRIDTTFLQPSDYAHMQFINDLGLIGASGQTISSNKIYGGAGTAAVQCVKWQFEIQQISKETISELSGVPISLLEGY